MRLAGYIISSMDDLDILPNAVESLLGIPSLSTLLIIDPGVFWTQHPLDPGYTVKEYVEATNHRIGKSLLQYASVPWDETAGGFSLLRNTAHKMLAKYDWVLFLDSDEIMTREAATYLTPLLHSQPESVSTIAPKWLTLWPDQTHYSPFHSTFLSHGRIVRPKQTSWVNAWHEHQNYTGCRVTWNRYIVHLRQLCGNRCLRQKGHDGSAWSHINDNISEVSELAVHFSIIAWPKGDESQVQVKEA
jgi:hypothetical protein